MHGYSCFAVCIVSIAFIYEHMCAYSKSEVDSLSFAVTCEQLALSIVLTVLYIDWSCVL
jgi:uncharacterized membrane protein (DUF485 family)